MTIRLLLAGAINSDAYYRVAGLYAQGKTQDAEARKLNPALPPLEIELFVNSWGGDPGSAFGIHNLLRATGLNVTAYNTGECSSSATIVFLAGHKRYASQLSFFKFHQMTWDFASSGNQAAARVQDVHASIEVMHDLWGKLVTDRTKLTSEVREFFNRTVCLTADEALKSGLIEGIKDPIV